MNVRNILRQTIAWTCSAGMIYGQVPAVERPASPVWWRPYVPVKIEPARMTNTERIHSLIRGGILYLTVQDAIALAIENDLNLQVARTQPLTAEWSIERAEAGGAPRGAPTNQSIIAAADAGLGVLGTASQAGISAGGASSSGGGGGGGVSVNQIGTTAQPMDPVFVNQTTFSHITYPEPIQVVSGVATLVDNLRAYSTTLTQGLITGGLVRFSSYEQTLTENAPTDNYNPASGPNLSLYAQIPLLQQRGKAVNTRQVKVAVNNKISARDQFRSQLETLVSSVVTQYWDLVTADDTLKANQQAQEIATKFYEDTKGQINLGTLAPVELPRAAAELEARKQDVNIALTTVAQREASLKDQLTRIPDPAIEAAHIVPLDHIEVPANDNLATLRDYYARAMAHRPDMAIAKVKDENSAISALGTADSLQPTLWAYGRYKDAGAAGSPQPSSGQPTSPFFSGGYGKALGQIFRNDFPSEYIGLYFVIPVGNRVAQADYGVEQAQIKQGDLSSQRDKNAILVDISNEMLALRQARSRYSVAVDSLKLQQDLLQAEKNRFSYGTGTLSAVVIAQRSAVAAQTTLINSLSIYERARVSLDKALGETLDVNHVSLDEGLDGHIARESKITEK